MADITSQFPYLCLIFHSTLKFVTTCQKVPSEPRAIIKQMQLT